MNYKDKKKLIKFFENSSKKGLLVWYGDDECVGKTFVSILISQNMIFKKKIKMVYFFSYSAERLKWIEKYCLKLDISEYISTVNYCDGKRVEYDFRDCLIVIDDSAHFIENVKKSKKVFRYWILIQNTNCKVLASCDRDGIGKLTDWVILQKILDPGSIPVINSGNNIDFKLIQKFKYEDEDPSEPQFIKAGVPTDIIYYNKLKKDDDLNYNNNTTIIRCEMSLFQFQNYYNVYMKEIQLIDKYKDSTANPQKYILASKHIESRKISNVFYLPNDFIRADILAGEYDTKTLLDENENEYQVRVKGWVKKNDLNIGIMSCKMVEFFINISNNYNCVNIVYSACVKKHGLILIDTLCSIYKINCINLVYSDESEIEKKMDDINTSTVPVLILIDPNTVDLLINENKKFKNKLCIHIFESELKNIFYKKLFQVCDDKNNNIYRYHSVAPVEPICSSDSTEKKGEKYFKCIDECLYEKNKEKEDNIAKFLNFLKKKSIF